MPLRSHRLLLVGIAMLACGVAPPLPAATTSPSFQVDYPYPTADKPQSKLWFADGSWWALLPRATGPSLWQRTGNAWKELPNVTRSVCGWPGRADVWFDADGATAVSISDRQLGIIRLARTGDRWTAEGLARLGSPESDSFETATIARDGRGRWWVAAVVQSTVHVWHSADARRWSRPYVLGRGLHTDDLGLITPVPGGVAVIWSNQKQDSVLVRTHLDEAPPEQWQAVSIVAKGGRTADDHLNAALTADGFLYIASKNSVDTAGAPQLVLRIRSPDGLWRNLPYGIRTKELSPSRPLVVATPDPSVLLLGHTVYAGADRRRDRVVFGRFVAGSMEVPPVETTVIQPGLALDTRINDVTGPKAAFPELARSWIVLSSDASGRVFEADVRPLARD